MRRVFAVLLVLVSAALGPPPGAPPPALRGAGPRARLRPPPFPGDTMATQRDSLMNVVMKATPAGNVPRERVQGHQDV
jgi:hypothetical protein